MVVLSSFTMVVLSSSTIVDEGFSFCSSTAPASNRVGAALFLLLLFLEPPSFGSLKLTDLFLEVSWRLLRFAPSALAFPQVFVFFRVLLFFNFPIISSIPDLFFFFPFEASSSHVLLKDRDL